MKTWLKNGKTVYLISSVEFYRHIQGKCEILKLLPPAFIFRQCGDFCFKVKTGVPMCSFMLDLNALYFVTVLSYFRVWQHHQRFKCQDLFTPLETPWQWRSQNLPGWPKWGQYNTPVPWSAKHIETWIFNLITSSHILIEETYKEKNKQTNKHMMGSHCKMQIMGATDKLSCDKNL